MNQSSPYHLYGTPPESFSINIQNNLVVTKTRDLQIGDKLLKAAKKKANKLTPMRYKITCFVLSGDCRKRLIHKSNSSLLVTLNNSFSTISSVGLSSSLPKQIARNGYSAMEKR